jgi:iron complex outermembrane receptor protein
VLPVGHPDNPNPFRVGLLYRFADLGNTHTEVTTDAGRVVAGLNGVWRDWDWESAILYSENKRTDTTNQFLHFPTLLAAVNNGTYRFSGNGTNSQALLDSLHPTYDNTGKSNITQWDLKGSREVYAMPAGPVMLATGFELRKEEMQIISDPAQRRRRVRGRGLEQRRWLAQRLVRVRGVLDPGHEEPRAAARGAV